MCKAEVVDKRAQEDNTRVEPGKTKQGLSKCCLAAFFAMKRRQLLTSS